MVLMVEGVLLTLMVPLASRKVDKPLSMSINDIAILQWEAILECEEREYLDEGIHVLFTRKGSVDMANTYHINGREVFVSLGTGRIYTHDQ